MLPIYLFCLVIGGGFAVLSAFGDLFGSDVGDLAPDAGVELDAALDGEVGGAVAGHAAQIFSLRSLVFSLFGFGATGSLMTWLGAGGTALTLGFSILAGLLVGGTVGSLLAYLKRSDTGSRGADRGFLGLRGRVSLPIRSDAAGRIVVRRGEREHTIRALPYPGSAGEAKNPGEWRDVVVIDMRDGVAYVEPLAEEDRDLLP